MQLRLLLLCLSFQKDLSSFEIDEIKEIGERGFARWLVGTEKTPAEVVKAITVGDPHRRAGFLK